MGIGAAIGAIAAGISDAVAAVGSVFAGIGSAVAGGLGLGGATLGGIGAGSLIGGALEGATLGGVLGGATDAITGKPILTGIGEGALGGAVTGFAAPLVGAATGLGATAADALTGAAVGAGGSALEGGNPLTGALTGGASGAVSGALSGLGSNAAAASPTTGGPGASAASVAAPPSLGGDTSGDIYGGGGAAPGTGVSGLPAPTGLPPTTAAPLASADAAGLQSNLAAAGGGSNTIGSLTFGSGDAGAPAVTPAGAAASPDLVNASGQYTLPPPAPDVGITPAAGATAGLSSSDPFAGNTLSSAPNVTASVPSGGGPNPYAGLGSDLLTQTGLGSGGTVAGALLGPTTTGINTPAAGATAGGSSLIPGISNSSLATLGLSGALLGYDALRGNEVPKGENAVSSTASQLGTQATQLESYLTSGTLPPGVQTALNQAAQSASAAIRSQYASLGMSGSSAEYTDLANVQNTIAAQGASIATNLLSQGVSEAGLASQLYGQIMQTSLAQDNQLSSALATLAASAARPTVALAASAL
jgi:trimeric autotransporter adhesin